jgi:K+-sensing histidine kinase KdpD
LGSVIFLEFVRKENSIRWNVKSKGDRVSKEKEGQLFDFNVTSSVGTLMEKGTGLGLGLCKRIANRIGYKVGYEWSKDGFNTFYLEKRL